jgi:hypothetical protein
VRPGGLHLSGLAVVFHALNERFGFALAYILRFERTNVLSLGVSA